MLIDIRHEGSHRDLPSLRLLRLASVTALNWLRFYYWIPQKNAIPYQSGKSANVRKEITSRLRELAFILKMKRHSGSSCSEVKGKRAKHNEQLMGAIVHGRNKLFSLMAGKSQSSKYVGSRKQLARNLRNLARLYSFFSSDVVSVLLEFLLKGPNSTDTMDSPDDFRINLNLEVAQAVFDEWKPVVIKFSKQEPELLLSLLKALLDIIESRKTIRDDFGGASFSLLQYDLETRRIAVLSSLFAWLVLPLKGLKSHHEEDQGSQTEVTFTMPKPALIGLMRRCLYISDPENHELLGSALLLGKMADSSYVKEKLHKLSLLTSLYSRATEDNPSDMKAEDLIHQDKHLRQAAEKLELLKLRKSSNPSALKTRDENVKNTNIWTVAKSWNPCPIGMLPRAVGSSGCLPVLDHDLDYKHEVASTSIDKEEHPESGQGNKREPSCDIETLNDSSIKRMRETENFDSSEANDLNVNISSDGLKGQLLIGGVWRTVGDQELEDIKSRVGILVTTRKR